MKSDFFTNENIPDPQLKKKQKNYRYYFKKNRDEILRKAGGKIYESHEYDIKPVGDYYELEKKILRKKLIRIVDDKNYYENMVAENLYNFVNSSTDNILANEIFIPSVFPYEMTDRFFYWFQLKVIMLESYSIPLLLDYHFEKYKNKTARKNSRKNKNDFLHRIENTVLRNLHNWTPFEYEKHGEQIVKWLREKKFKLKSSYLDPGMEQEDRKKEQDQIESADEFEELMLAKKLQDFKEVEKELIHANYIESVNGKLKWIKSKSDFVIWILGLNEKKYFVRNILEQDRKKTRKNIKSVFEKRYAIKLREEFQYARISRIDLKLFQKKIPYSLIQ